MQLFCFYLVLAPQLLQEDCPIPPNQVVLLGLPGTVPTHGSPSKACQSSPLGLGTAVRRDRPLSLQAPSLGPEARTAGSQAPSTLGRKWS